LAQAGPLIKGRDGKEKEDGKVGARTTHETRLKKKAKWGEGHGICGPGEKGKEERCIEAKKNSGKSGGPLAAGVKNTWEPCRGTKDISGRQEKQEPAEPAPASKRSRNRTGALREVKKVVKRSWPKKKNKTQKSF